MKAKAKKSNNGKNGILRLFNEIVAVQPPDIKKLPRDPEWEALEVRLVAHTNKKLPPFED